MKTLSEGEYVTIQQDEYNRLIIKATITARNLRARGELWWYGEDTPEHTKVGNLLYDFFGKDWYWPTTLDVDIQVSDYCTILTNDATVEDDGSFKVFGGLWYHERYAVELFSEQVFEGGVMMLPVSVQEVTP